MKFKVHLLPPAARAKYAMCSATIGTKRSVSSKEEFNRLPPGERCGRCDAMINGRLQSSERGNSTSVVAH